MESLCFKLLYNKGKEKTQENGDDEDKIVKCDKDDDTSFHDYTV